MPYATRPSSTSAPPAPSLPYLRKALGHHDPEIRRRALRLVPGLEHAALVVPKRISMTAVQSTHERRSRRVEQAVRLQGLAHGQQRLPPGHGAGSCAKDKKEKRFSFTFLNAPFWDVIDRLCRETNLVVSPSWGDEAVRLIPATGYAVPLRP